MFALLKKIPWINLSAIIAYSDSIDIQLEVYLIITVYFLKSIHRTSGMCVFNVRLVSWVRNDNKVQNSLAIQQQYSSNTAAIQSRGQLKCRSKETKWN